MRKKFYWYPGKSLILLIGGGLIISQTFTMPNFSWLGFIFLTAALVAALVAINVEATFRGRMEEKIDRPR